MECQRWTQIIYPIYPNITILIRWMMSTKHVVTKNWKQRLSSNLGVCNVCNSYRSRSRATLELRESLFTLTKNNRLYSNHLTPHYFRLMETEANTGVYYNNSPKVVLMKNFFIQLYNDIRVCDSVKASAFRFSSISFHSFSCLLQNLN